MLTIAVQRAHEKGIRKQSKDEQNNMKATIVRLAVLPESQEIVLLLVFIRHSCCIVVPPNQDPVVFFLLTASLFNCRV